MTQSLHTLFQAIATANDQRELRALRGKPALLASRYIDTVSEAITAQRWGIYLLGLTNAEIGVELWITENSVKQALKRMFRKLEVSARTEMVARFRDNLDF